MSSESSYICLNTTSSSEWYCKEILRNAPDTSSMVGTRSEEQSRLVPACLLLATSSSSSTRYHY